MQDACIAIACPVTEDWVAMTNHSWAFSIKEMKASRAEPSGSDQRFHRRLDGDPDALVGRRAAVWRRRCAAGPTIAVYGAGTGLRSLRVHVDRRWVSLPGEGGHFAPNSEERDIILEVLRAEVGHVPPSVCCPAGPVNLYRAIVKADNRLPEKWEPKDITERALADSCIDCRRALSLFCVIMGRFGGNRALNLGTFGGVYIAGGIVPRFMEFFKASGFRAAFEDKGAPRLCARNPVFMITHGQPGLLGAGAHLRQTLGMHL